MQLSISDIRRNQLNILDSVTNFCDENNLEYFLAYGTLLGAVRHKGYIPWDDDIDIVMPRSDYMKFINSFNKENKSLRVHATELDSKFLYPFAKVSNQETLLIENSAIKYEMGINIDIFPLDGIANDDKSLLKKQRILKQLLNLKIIRLDKKRSVMKNLILLTGRIMLCMLPVKIINQKMIELSQTYSFDEEIQCCNISTGDLVDKPIPKKYFQEKIKISFEGKEYTTTKYYHEWLSSVYGDYNKLPPKEKQVSHHSMKAYYRE